MESLERTAAVMALAEAVSPHLSTNAAVRFGRLLSEWGADRVLSGDFGDGEVDADDEDDVEWLRKFGRVPEARVEYWRLEIVRLAERGITVATVNDEAYPVNLQLVHNKPPLLFVRGVVTDADQRAVAVVGTRNVSAEGYRRAQEIARSLAAAGVTVVSGLAAGVDTAAHSAALEAGGRTIAVFGTGIERVFPRENAGLARSVVMNGACVSQFWPGQSGARWTFPRRNIVTSGLSLGTVVVEASDTSGARLQAAEAVGHGRRLFLPESLLAAQQWARDLEGLASVTIMRSLDDVLSVIATDLAAAAGPAPF